MESYVSCPTESPNATRLGLCSNLQGILLINTLMSEQNGQPHADDILKSILSK